MFCAIINTYQVRKLVIYKDLLDALTALDEGKWIDRIIDGKLDRLPILLQRLPLATMDFDFVLSAGSEVQLRILALIDFFVSLLLSLLIYLMLEIG